MTTTTVSAGALANLHDYERDALPYMRKLAAAGFTPTATAHILAAMRNLDVGSLETFARHVKHYDPELQGATYKIGAFSVGDGRRGGNEFWRRGRALIDAERLGIAS
jgi:hypothetical protein